MAGAYEKEPFDLIFDCVGDQKLFSDSPKYLQPAGQLISIVGGRTGGVVPFVRNKLVPRFLGGTPRTYKLLALGPSGEYAREVAGWIGKGYIRDVPIDSEYAMEDVVKVAPLFPFLRSLPPCLHSKLTESVRLMRGSCPRGQRAR